MVFWVIKEIHGRRTRSVISIASYGYVEFMTSIKKKSNNVQISLNTRTSINGYLEILGTLY